jgi:hypothetical protein
VRAGCNSTAYSAFHDPEPGGIFRVADPGRRLLKVRVPEPTFVTLQRWYVAGF